MKWANQNLFEIIKYKTERMGPKSYKKTPHKRKHSNINNL